MSGVFDPPVAPRRVFEVYDDESAPPLPPGGVRPVSEREFRRFRALEAAQRILARGGTR